VTLEPRTRRSHGREALFSRRSVERRWLQTWAFGHEVLPAIVVLPVDSSTHSSAQTTYRASLPSGASFLDEISFAVIEREAIDTAIVLDSDFVRPGLTVLPPG
jgi:predicted nucleic acid-binding protein